MRCPGCGLEGSKVVDSRSADESTSIRRRRVCDHCAHRFTTFERIEELPLIVVKRSGDRQPFDRCRIVAGVRAAAKGRPVEEGKLDEIAVAVEDAARVEGNDVSSERVGRLVLDQLTDLDEVTALRFASVYKGFTEMADFERELRLIKKELIGPAES
ncbi:MAG: transcriptional regulator NrdR [Acidimicrobiales bacterium]